MNGTAHPTDETPAEDPRLPESECWRLLSRSAVSRVAFERDDGVVDVSPVNHEVTDRRVLFRSEDGARLDSIRTGRPIALEVDGYEPSTRTAWSVTARGRARLATVGETDMAAVTTWLQGQRPHIIVLDPDDVTGRRYHVADDAVPDASIGWEQPPHDDSGLAVLPHPDDPHHPGEPFLHPD